MGLAALPRPGDLADNQPGDGSGIGKKNDEGYPQDLGHLGSLDVVVLRAVDEGEDHERERHHVEEEDLRHPPRVAAPAQASCKREGQAEEDPVPQLDLPGPSQDRDEVQPADPASNGSDHPDRGERAGQGADEGE